MFAKIITRARVLAAFFCAAAVATIVVASPVVVTPGASAGYLYFPTAPAPASSASDATGGGRDNPVHDPVTGTCGGVTTIGQECEWGDGSKVKLALTNTGGFKKIFVGQINPALEYHKLAVGACKNTGTGYTLPSISILGAIWANRALIGGITGSLESSTQSASNSSVNYVLVNGVQDGNYRSYGLPFLCIRTIA